jgi:MFS family permease
MRRSEVFEPLRNRPFRLLWLGTITSATGSGFTPVALAFAVLSVGGTATSLGLVLLAGIVAGLASSLVAGVWADRLTRRDLMLAADLIRMLVQAGVAALLLTGTARIWQLALASVMIATASSFFGPASTGLIAELLPADQLQKANSLLSVSTRTASIAAPALSGLLVATAGAGWSFAVDAASFAGSAAFLARMPGLGRAQATPQRFFADLAEGWHELAARNWLWLNLAAQALWNMAFTAFLVLGPVLAVARLGGPSGWGLVSAGLSIGAVIGGLLAIVEKSSRPLVLGNLALILGALPLLALAARLPVYVIMAAAVAGTAGSVVLNTSWVTVMQQLIPNEILGRIRSYDYLLTFIAMPAGFAGAGPLAAAFGADKVLVAAAGLMAVSAGVAVALPAVWSIVRQENGQIITAAAASRPGRRLPAQGRD